MVPHHSHFFWISMLLAILIIFLVRQICFIAYQSVPRRSRLSTLADSKPDFGLVRYTGGTKNGVKRLSNDYQRYLSNKKAPVKSAILIDYNQFNYLIIRYLPADASSYSHWLSIGYILKVRLLKNLLVFLRKIEDLTFFLSAHSEKREKSKNSPLRPWQTPSAKIGHVGVYFAKMGCKIEGGFTDIFGVVSHHLGWADRVLCLAFAPGLLKVLQPKDKMAGTI